MSAEGSHVPRPASPLSDPRTSEDAEGPTSEVFAGPSMSWYSSVQPSLSLYRNWPFPT